MYKEFDSILGTFSKDRVSKGSFDKFIGSGKKKKGTAVDKEFLESLDKWRIALAENVALRNDIDEDELNFVVQSTLDRLIFLRIAEDRQVERYGQLKEAARSASVLPGVGGDYYQSLLRHFQVIAQKYISGLFDFGKDKISQKITIDNKVIESIVSELYYPKCPYEFSVLSVEILGSAYEQFLGKSISLSKSGRVTIEEKPEVRKAGGVYYTPQYVVDYIVKNTVGKLVENMTPKEVSQIRVCDPACGSGGFLIGAYQFLMNWHRDFYHGKGIGSFAKTLHNDNPLTPAGELTPAEKKRILVNSIYGVDLDSNAVEVTKLSLLLKCMEGETQETIEAQSQLFYDGVLPNLENNIKSGNSLIDLDYCDGRLDCGEGRQIKPFSWKKSFPEVFRQGGFDCVIGNPPYLKLTTNNSNPTILNYYKNRFAAYSGGGSKNIFQLFIEKMAQLNPQTFSFIVPEALLTTSSNGKTREVLLQNHSLSSIVTFDHFVFPDATIGTTIFVAERQPITTTRVYKMSNSGEYLQTQELQIVASEQAWETSLDNTSKELFEKMIRKSISMKELVSMSKGMVVKNRKDALVDKPDRWSLPFLLGNCMNRYQLRYNKHANYEKLEIIGGTRDFLKQTTTPRLLIRRTGGILCATYSENRELVESTLYILTSNKINLKFLLGLINSRLLTYFLQKKLLTNTQGFPQVLMGQLEQLPIAQSNTEQETEISKYVDQLLQLNRELQTATVLEKIEQIESRIAYCEDKIDDIVYWLYGLTAEEVTVMESERNKSEKFAK